jgi:hypothetical protein
MFTKLLLLAGLITMTFAAANTAPAPQKPIFEDSFNNLDNWQPEGPFTPTIVDGRLHIKTVYEPKKVGEYVWCKKELPADFRLEYDFTPARDTGEKGFFLLFFCQQGVKGEDILGDDLFNHYLPARDWKADEDFDKYVSAANRKSHHQSRIRGYHTSYLRGESATCNLRKNPGLVLLKQSKLDEKLPKEKTAHIILTKQAGHITLTLNGEVFMDHTDDKDVYSGGRFGFRQVYDSDGYYDNVKLFDLTK